MEISSAESSITISSLSEDGLVSSTTAQLNATGFDLDSYNKLCLNIVNKYRKEAGLPLHKRAKSNEACTQKHAVYDSDRTSPHAGFKAHICSASFATENEGFTHGLHQGQDYNGFTEMLIQKFAYGKHQHHKNQMGPNAKGLSCGFSCGPTNCVATQDYSNKY